MRKLAPFFVWLHALALAPAVVHAEGPRGGAGPEDRLAARERSTAAAQAVAYRNVPDGLALGRPYARGKNPVVFIHGLWAGPWCWNGMISALEADRELRERYQFWTFGYRTGDSIPISASLLRQSLVAARRQFDPEKTDPAFDGMVLVGHSMGGLVAKMLVVDSGSRLWNAVSDRPFEQLAGTPEDRNLLGGALVVKPLQGVRSVVFIATPHRGSRLSRGWIQTLGAGLVPAREPLRSAYDRLIECNNPGYFKEGFRKSLPSSIEELQWEAPLLQSLRDLPVAPRVKLHSIIAVRPDGLTAERTDGLVSYASAHLENANSEVVVSASHLCQNHPEVIREVQQVLLGRKAP